MMAKRFGSAAKGRIAEREVAKLCQAWWQQLEPGCEFCRTPLSGGWSGQSVRAHFRASGDLMTTADHWPFTVEVKRRECWSVARFFKGKSSPVWSWWRQSVRQAEEESRVPMLWVRKNQYRPGTPAFPWFVMLPEIYEFEVLRRGPFLKPDVRWSPDLLAENKVDYAEEIPALWLADRLLFIDPSAAAGV